MLLQTKRRKSNVTAKTNLKLIYLRLSEKVLLVNMLDCLLSNLFMASANIFNKFIDTFNDIMLQLPTS